MRTIIVGAIILVGSSVAHAQVRGVEAGSAEAAQQIYEYRERMAEADAAWTNSTKLSHLKKIPAGPVHHGDCLHVDQLKDKDVGFLEYWQFEVLQVVGPNDVLLAMNNIRMPPIWLTDYPTKGLADREQVRLVGLIEVDGTKKYTAVSGGQKTVRVVRLLSPEKMLAYEKQKREEEENKLFRIWTSANGEFEVDAKFLDFSDGKVQLEKRDGEKIAVSPSQISKEDVEYYRDVLKERREAEKRKK